MIDQIIVGAYLAITLIIGLYVGRNVKNMREFAIGNRDFSTLMLVSTVFASIVEASDTMGLAGSTFHLGPVFLLSYLGIVLSRFTLAIFIAPKMEPFLGLISAGDIFEKLFGKRAKTLMGISTFVESTLIAGAQVLAISQISQYFFHISGHIAGIGTCLVIILYSLRGGIRSVTATDVFQFWMLIIAIPIICGIGISSIGGYQSLITTFSSFQSKIDYASEFNIGHQIAVFISFALPCLYPLCIQRMLMAKDTNQIRNTFLINGFLSIPFYIVVGLIGIIAFIIIPTIDPNNAFIALIDHIAPVGIKGFIIAGLLAIIMSTVDSILNIGAIAITHDLFGSLVRAPFDAKTELRLVRISTIAVAIGSVAVAFQFTNVLDVIFLMMVLGNSVFFPGYLLGVLGLQGSKRTFWIGVVLGLVSVAVCFYIFDLFPLYTMLIAISVNASVHLIELGLKKQSLFSVIPAVTLNLTARFTNISRTFVFNNWVKSQDYCSIFAICSIAVSLFPFFNPANGKIADGDIVFLTLNTITATASFFILLREFWHSAIRSLFSILWAILLIIALPMQTTYMFIESQLSLIWLIDLLVILPLLSILTSQRSIIVSYAVGFVSACALSLSFQSETSLAIKGFGQWSVFMHSISLAICLALFRKKDVEMYRSTSAFLVHEANRSLSTFESAARYYERLLPDMVLAYEKHVPANQRSIPTDDLQEMLSLPNDLRLMSLRTQNALTKLLHRIVFYTSHQNFSETCNLAKCINLAAEEPLFASKRNTISIHEKESLEIFGDQDQLTQVFINLIENSLRALRNNPNPKIEIVLDNKMVTVIDNGEGIPDSVLPNIFDEQFSTKENGGKGLAYCKRIIIEHGGSITCSSKPKQFTRFEISFPENFGEAIQ